MVPFMTDKYSKLSQEELHRIFEYKDGELYRKYSKNPNYIGKKASIPSIERHRYNNVFIDRKSYSVHKIIFKMFHGYCPKIIMHLDNNLLNNKIENLAKGTRSQVTFRQKMRIDNKSGLRGVCWNKYLNKWKSQITFENKKINLGHFDDKIEAYKTYYKTAKNLHGSLAIHILHKWELLYNFIKLKKKQIKDFINNLREKYAAKN